jgi:hypothetical protein
MGFRSLFLVASKPHYGSISLQLIGPFPFLLRPFPLLSAWRTIPAIAVELAQGRAPSAFAWQGDCTRHIHRRASRSVR